MCTLSADGRRVSQAPHISHRPLTLHQSVSTTKHTVFKGEFSFIRVLSPCHACPSSVAILLYILFSSVMTNDDS